MVRHGLSRLVAAAVMVLLATLVIFLIANTVPGDPVLAQLGDIAASDPAIVAEYRDEVGPRPAAVGAATGFSCSGLAHGDLGISIGSRRPVLTDIARIRAGDDRAGHRRLRARRC